MRALTWSCLVLLAVGCGGESSDLSAADRAHLQGLMQEIDEASTAASARRLATLRDAAASMRPDPSAPECPRPLPPSGDIEMDVHHAFLEPDQLLSGYDPLHDPHRALARSDEPSLHLHGPIRSIGHRGRRIQILSNLRSSIEYQLSEGSSASTLDVDRWADRLDWELVVLVETYSEPRHDGTAFVDGVLRGRAFLYDYAEDAIVCVGPVDAHSSESVTVRYDPTRDGLRGNQALLDDLQEHALESALAGLRASAD